MVEFLILAAIVVGLGIAFSVLSLVMWVLFLPFKLIALSYKLLATLLLLPFLLIIAVFGAVVFGMGAVLLLLPPLLPFALLAWGIWWLVKRNRSGVTTQA